MVRSRFNTAALLMSVSILALTGCTSQDRQDAAKKAENLKVQDRELGYTRDDYRKAMAPRSVETTNGNSNVPELAPVISDDKKNILPQPLVSITVNQDVPLRDIFYELAKQAEVDLELDPTITGSVIFTAYNRPFDQVVERLSDMAGLRVHFKNNILRVERDTPYVKTYHVGYLSVQRDTTSSINSNTSASSGGGSSGGGGNNGSSSSISTKSSTDFWNELQVNITQIIKNTNQQVSLTDTSTPIVMTPQAIPAMSGDALTAVNGVTPAPAAAPTSITVNMAQPTAGLANPTGVTASTANGTAAAAPAGAGVAAASPYYSVNKQAGIVTIFATEKQHEKIGKYIQEMMQSVNTQVLIEAKVFEVELNDQNSLGIDWRLVGDDVKGIFALPQTNFLSGTQFPANTGGIFSYQNGDFSAVVNAISRFGTVRTLSSPRLSVMNNQSAVLNVSENRVFFDLDVQQTQGTQGSGAGTLTTVTSEVKTVPEGIVINVHPSVDTDTNEITMNLRPSITRVVRTVADPAVAFVAAGTGLQNLIPELSTREIDSMVKMNSGNAIIMGGLMQDRVESEQVSIPVLGEIPIFGNLFRSQRDLTRKTEMIIMLRAVVVNDPKPDQTDKALYEKMSQDRRPFSVE